MTDESQDNVSEAPADGSEPPQVSVAPSAEVADSTAEEVMVQHGDSSDEIAETRAETRAVDLSRDAYESADSAEGADEE
jgi:hypothetical protein